MKKQLKLVKEFHDVCKIYSQEKPNIHIPESVRTVRQLMLEEEVQEVKKAIEQEDLIESARELADVLYVLLGTVHGLGIQEQFEAVFEEVHNSNMSRLDENGKPIQRADGKILKSTNYREPNIKQFFLSDDIH